MKLRFQVYGQKYGEWYYVDTFTTKEAAIREIEKELEQSKAYRAFAKYVAYKIDEIYSW